jgi:hypothetical protein
MITTLVAVAAVAAVAVVSIAALTITLLTMITAAGVTACVSSFCESNVRIGPKLTVLDGLCIYTHTLHIQCSDVVM